MAARAVPPLHIEELRGERDLALDGLLSGRRSEGHPEADGPENHARRWPVAASVAAAGLVCALAVFGLTHGAVAKALRAGTPLVELAAKAAPESITIERPGITLSTQGPYVVYSPKEGVMASWYPRYFFNAADFRRQLGDVKKVKKGTVVMYTVLSSQSSVRVPGDATLPAPEGGFLDEDTVCKIVGVRLPGATADTKAPAEPLKEQRVVVQRPKTTLAREGPWIVYSPKQGVMTDTYPRFFFNAEDAEHMLGALEKVQAGTALVCGVLSSEKAVSSTGNAELPTPEGGFKLEDTLCKLLRVEKPEV